MYNKFHACIINSKFFHLSAVLYIDILTIINNFPYSTCISSFFGSSIPTSLFIFKMFLYTVCSNTVAFMCSAAVILGFHLNLETSFLYTFTTQVGHDLSDLNKYSPFPQVASIIGFSSQCASKLSNLTSVPYFHTFFRCFCTYDQLSSLLCIFQKMYFCVIYVCIYTYISPAQLTCFNM